MLMAHKFLDAALKRDPKYSFWVKPGTPDNVPKNLIRAVVEAEKFDFGELVLEYKPDINKYRLPDLTDDEREFWVEGLIPLPAPICWFEYSLGGVRTGLLVTEDHEGIDPHDYYWIVQRVDRKDTEFQFDGALAGIRRTQQDPKSPRWTIAYGGNKTFIKPPVDNPAIHQSFMADMMLSIYLTLMINSKTTEIRSEAAPPKLNKIRERKGETPLFDHHVVTIVPTRYLRDAERVAQGTHASPRLHWRRSHKRTYDHPTPRAKQTSNGWVVAIPRCIIGLADRGVVSHEYRVLAAPDES